MYLEHSVTCSHTFTDAHSRPGLGWVGVPAGMSPAVTAKRRGGLQPSQRVRAGSPKERVSEDAQELSPRQGAGKGARDQTCRCPQARNGDKFEEPKDARPTRAGLEAPRGRACWLTETPGQAGHLLPEQWGAMRRVRQAGGVVRFSLQIHGAVGQQGNSSHGDKRWWEFGVGWA